MNFHSASRLALRFALVILAAPSVTAAVSDSCTAFVDVTVVPMDSQRLLSHQTVVVRGETIERIVKAGSANAQSGCTVVRGEHRYLVPGLVDSHVHLPLKGEADQRLVLQMLLANGITTGINMEGSPEIVALRDRIDRRQIAGPKLYTTGPFIQQPRFMTADQVTGEVVAEKQAGYDFIKVHGQLTREAYDALFAAARAEKIRVVGHVPDNLGIDAALGRQSLIVHAEEYLYSYFQFERPQPTEPAEIQRMVREIARKTAQSGTWVSPTLSVFRQIIAQAADIDAVVQRPEMRYMPRHLTTGVPVGAPDFAWYPPNNRYLRIWPLEKLPYLRSEYSLMQQLVRGLRDAGVPLLAGTDPFVPCVVPGFSLKDEFEQLYAAGLTPYEVLQTATFNPARFLGTTSATGTVARGKVADLVLLDANPLTDVDNAFLQAGLMLRGHWLTKDELQAQLLELVQAATEPGDVAAAPLDQPAHL